MCRAVSCPKCGKTTWAGCGQHVDQVLASVPVNRRCTCNPTTTASAAAASTPKASGGIFGRLLGR